MVRGCSRTRDDADYFTNLESGRENAVLPRGEYLLANLNINISRHIFHLEQLFLAGTYDHAESARRADLAYDSTDAKVFHCNPPNLRSHRAHNCHLADEPSICNHRHV